MPSFGNSSLRKRETIHPVLQLLCDRVVEHHDITLITGHRSKTDQNKAFNNGLSSKEWPKSKHNTRPSMAVDAAPWPIPAGWGGLTGKTIPAINLAWKERVKFYEMISVFRYCWAQLCKEQKVLASRYSIRFGADWDGDGDYRDQNFDDLPHIELIEV